MNKQSVGVDELVGSADKLAGFAPALFKPSVRTIARENVSIVTSRGTRRSREAHFRDGPAGNGQPVLLIPGFLAGDWSMSNLARALRGWGFAPARSGIGLNVDCTNAMLDRLEERLEVVARRSGASVSIVGWSRGGTLGKLLAMRRPELVTQLVTLASPNANPLAVNTMVARQLKVLIRLNRAGVRNVMGTDCVHGQCADSIGAALASEFPASVPYTSIYTRQDGVVDWRACLDPDAKLIEVHSTHLGIGNDARVLRLVGDELATAGAVEAVVPKQRSDRGD